MIAEKFWTHRGGLCGLLRLGAALMFISLIEGQPALADDQGWVLTQKSSTLGDQYVYISPNGLKCYNPRVGFALVSKAPDWNITLYNEKTRCYYATSLDHYKQELDSRGIKGEMANRNWNRGVKGNICGLNATQYVTGGASGVVRLPNGKVKRQTISDAAYWVSDDITVPARLADLLATAYGLPTTQNVPLRLKCTQAGAQKVLLETYRSQQAPMPISYFQCPQGFTLVKSDAEVMMNDEQKQILNDMAKELGSSDSAPPAAATAAVPANNASAPSAVAQSGTAAGGASSSSGTTNVGGLKLDKDKVQRFLDALKKSSK